MEDESACFSTDPGHLQCFFKQNSIADWADWGIKVIFSRTKIQLFIKITRTVTQNTS